MPVLSQTVKVTHEPAAAEVQSQPGEAQGVTPKCSGGTLEGVLGWKTLGKTEEIQMKFSDRSSE